MQCFITADGKGMHAAHFLSGLRCWTCASNIADASQLAHQDSVGTHVRYGAFLTAIPMARCMGDYVHCMNRTVNVVMERRSAWASPRARTALAAFIQSVQDEAAHVLLFDRIAPFQTVAATLDLTASKLFLLEGQLRGQLVSLVEEHSAGATTIFLVSSQ